MDQKEMEGKGMHNVQHRYSFSKEIYVTSNNGLFFLILIW